MSQTRAICDFYRITERGDGLVDVWRTPGEIVPSMDDLTGRVDYGIRVRVVHGIDLNDPQWGRSLEEHIRMHYAAWLESAEEIEI
jgi:hypothetical protein